MASPITVEPERLAAAGQTGTTLGVWAELMGDRTAIFAPTGSRSFQELDGNANRLARVLRDNSLQAGDSVAIVCSNRAEFVEIVYACLRTGLRYTPVNWHLTGDEAAYVVRNCGAKALIGESRFAESMQAAASTDAVTLRLAIGGDIPGFDSYADAIRSQSPEAIANPALGNRMLYTSGTTGKPKGVIRPPRYSTGLDAITKAPKYVAGSDQLNLCTGPLYHGGPLGLSLTAALAAGVGVVLMPRWDAADALRLIAEHRITHTHMVPTMFHRLLRLPEDVRASADVSSLQYVLHGAAPCPVETKKQMIEWFGPIIWEYFAATEGAASSISSQQWLSKPGSVGVPADQDRVRIFDEDGEQCEVGVSGGIYLQSVGDGAFEYFDDPAKTAANRVGDYSSMGDIGYLDSDGFLFITDREAEVIVSGGVNIYPAEIEEAMLAHPGVADVAVIGIPDDEWGEQVLGVVLVEQGYVGQSEPGVGPDLEADILDFTKGRIAGFKCPRRLEFSDSLPRYDNGKLYRERLREEFRQRGASEQPSGQSQNG